MKLYMIIGGSIALIAISFTIYIKVQQYIFAEVERKYQQRISTFFINKQNEELKKIKLDTSKFNSQALQKKTEIVEKVKYIKVKDDTCQEKLNAIVHLNDLIYESH